MVVGGHFIQFHSSLDDRFKTSYICELNSAQTHDP
jgi:hypothetical protein